MFPNPAAQNRTADIATRLRGKLGELRVSQSQLARLIHMNKASVSRRLAGDHPWRIDELEMICNALRIDLDEVLTGKRMNPRPDHDPDGGKNDGWPTQGPGGDKSS